MSDSRSVNSETVGSDHMEDIRMNSSTQHKTTTQGANTAPRMMMSKNAPSQAVMTDRITLTQLAADRLRHFAKR